MFYRVPPEQQLYTIVLNCAQEASPEAVELKGMIEATLPPTPTPDASGFSPGGIAEVSVLPLTVSRGSQPLWAVFSVGMRSFGEPPQNHFIAIYTHSDVGWQELTRQELAGGTAPEATEPSPDYIFEESVRQVNVEPSRIWLQKVLTNNKTGVRFTWLTKGKVMGRFRCILSQARCVGVGRAQGKASV